MAARALGCEVVTFTANLGQGEELEPARRKAEALGVKEIFIEDMREEFTRDFVFPMFRANALLRTSLDKRSDRLKAVFTGSSREGLAAMFSARHAPFFHFAIPIELPALGTPFVDHVLGTFRRMSRRTLARRDMLRAFEKLHANPYFFRVLVETLLHDPALGVEAALGRVRERIAADLGYPGVWLGLAPVQRATARGLAGGTGRPFSQRFRQAVGVALGEETPPAARIQAALRRLERLGLADTHTGDWALVDPELAAWIRENDGGPPGP